MIKVISLSLADQFMDIIDYFLIIVTALLATPVAMFFLEIVAAIVLRGRDDQSFTERTLRPRVAVLVPAHNESAVLQLTIADIQAQLHQNDRLLVVADNCSDDTARVAAAAGAEVVERNDLSRIGKGYALDWGFHHLSADAPEIVIIIDADCRVAVGTIDRLAATSALTRRPAQSLDLMKAPDQSSINYQVAEFAWRVKNWVRPLGLRALGLPCQLMGTGMAFPWGLISSMNLASSEIVEDLKLGLDLALAGSPPIFCPDAVVTSQFPLSGEAAAIQRQRWEQGHMGMILTAAPRLIWQALVRRNFPLLALVLDLAVPPLTLLGLLTIVTISIDGAAFMVGFSPTALIISACSLSAFMVAVFVSWLRCGRDVLPANDFLAVAQFILAKFSLYRRMSRGVPPHWIGTDREQK
jgi:cellulose synthase/poly-beta-1,6-N-acetylglucosamine synthase-like glycosyltransferase